MQRAGALDDFLKRPAGRYYQSRNFVYWLDGNAGGSIVWGRIEERDAAEYVRALDVALTVPPYASLHDCRQLESLTPRAFERVTQHLSARRDQYAPKIRKRAVLRPVGFWGSFVAGFFDVATAGSPTRVFADVPSALAWLGIGDMERELTSLASLGAVPAPLGALRRLLSADHGDISMDAAAQRLGTSRRTLQRHLHEAHTTFPRELARARVAAAQELLLSSAANLTEAAYSAGFASTQQFSRTFRVLTGQTPRAWLAHSRAR